MFFVGRKSILLLIGLFNDVINVFILTVRKYTELFDSRLTIAIKDKAD